MNMTPFGTISLGGLIRALEGIVDNRKRNVVYVGMFGVFPSKLDSYRGYYDHLALGYSAGRDNDYVTVDEMLKRLRAAVGEQYDGYKGGTYRMNENTPVWVSNYGSADGNKIVGLDVNDHRIVLTVESE